MVIHNLDFVGVAVGETKADTPLVIDPDRMPAGAVASQRFKSVRGRQPQIINSGSRIQLPQPHCATS
jgi:hypothetical protein